jgi:hypothetical protein
VNVEIQALETNLPPVAVATHSAIKRGAPQTIEFQATQSTDPNDQVVSYRFQAKLEGASTWTLDTDWQASGFANLTFPSVGRWQVLTSARDKFGAVGQTENLIEILPNSLPTLQITYGIFTNQAPYRVQVRANSTDADGDTLLYNFTFSNGQTTGFQALSTAVSMFNVSGNQSVTVTVRDQNGGETVGTASFVLGGNLVPIASFSFASPRAGYAPHTVSFDASNSSDPDGSANDLQYFWNFGDGANGTGKLVDHTFQLGGEYIVTLTVVDPLNGAGSQSRAIFSWTNEPPVPRYTVTAVPGTLQRIFNASGSTPGDSAIQRYNFETGDGNFIVQTTPIYTHTYLNGGVYNTSLRVYDTEGDANITGQTITVFNGQKPAANINLLAADVVTPATFLFNAQGSASPNNGATINGWRWTLPDGQIVLGPELFYHTNTHGNFSITLQVRDSFGFWSDPVTQEFSATSGVLPIARIEASKTSATPNEPIRFSGLTSSTLNANANLVSYEWSTPSGTKFYGPEVDIGLSQLGLNTVTLIVTDSKGYVSEPASFQVNISTPTKPVAIFTLSDAGNIIPIWRHADGRASHATAPGAEITGYEWRVQAPSAMPNGIDFNLYGPEVDILFDQAVTYTVSLRVFDSSGGTSDWVSQTFGPLQNTKPIANLLPGSITVTAPAIINFSSLGSFDPDGHDIIGYYWDMGDGLDRYESNFQHQYNLPGVYTVEFSVQDSFGLWSDPVFATITVVENELPIPVITMQDDPGGNRFKKLFSATQSSDPDGEIVEYHWFVAGQPRFASGPEVEYTFPAPGHYTIGLDVTDNKGAASFGFYQVEILENQAPVIRARYEVDDMNPMRFSLDGSASTDDTAITSYVWRNGSDVIGTTSSLNHVFPTEGVQNVSLEITDTDGASASKSFSIYAFETGAADLMLHEPSQNVVEPETGIDFIATEPIPLGAWPKALILQPRLRQASADDLSYSWRINDVEISTSQTPQIAFTNPGQTKLSLVITDGESILAKVSRPIEPDIMSCGPTYSEEGVRCLTIPGVHSVLVIANETEFAIPLGSNYSQYQLGSVSMRPAETVLDGREVDLTGIAILRGENLMIPASFIRDSQIAILGPWRFDINLIDPSENSLSLALPYATFGGVPVTLPQLQANETLLFRDALTGMILYEFNHNQGSTAYLPSTNIDLVFSSTSRKPATGTASLRAGSGYTIAFSHTGNSELNSIAITETWASSNTAPTQLSATLVAQSTNAPLSAASGVVAFMRTVPSDTANSSVIPSDYKEFRTDFVPLQSIVNQLGVMNADLLPWGNGDIGTNPGVSTIKTIRHLECRAFEGNWKQNAISYGLRARYSAYVSAQRLNAEYSHIATPIEIKLNESTGILRSRGYLHCGLNNLSPDYPCLISAIPHETDPTSLAERYKIAQNYPALRKIEAEWSTIAPSISAAISDYENFGLNSGVDIDHIKGASWRNYYRTSSTRYKVTASFLIDGKPDSKSEIFSSENLRGKYNPGPLPQSLANGTPADLFQLEGLKSVKLKFEFPANARSIEFRVEPLDLMQDHDTTSIRGFYFTNHFSVSYKERGATCRLSSPGYMVESITLNKHLLSPTPNDIDKAWAENSFNLWPDLTSSTQRIFENSLPNKILHRFTTYAARSVLRSNGFLPTDFDQSATIRPNQLKLASAATGQSIPAESAVLIPTRVVVGHFGLDIPVGVRVLGSVGGDSMVLGSQSNRVVGESNANRSVFLVSLPLASMMNQLRERIIDQDGRPQLLDYQLEIEPILASGIAPTSVITLNPLLNARYERFIENQGALQDTYSLELSPMVNANLARVVSLLRETGVSSSQPNHENDFYINDGSLPFGGKLGPHKTHSNGRVLDIRTFGVRNSQYEYVNKNAPPEGVFAENFTKYAHLALLVRASLRAEQYNSTTPEANRVKSENECHELSNAVPPTCDLATEVTVEDCLFLRLDQPPTNCTALRNYVSISESSWIGISPLTLQFAHAEYRNYVLRNREALQSLASRLDQFSIPRPTIIYSNGDGDSAKRAFSAKINLMIGFREISKTWNVRSLEKGDIPLRNTTVNTQLLKLLGDNGAPIGLFNNPFTFKPDEGLGHLDHYHIMVEN